MNSTAGTTKAVVDDLRAKGIKAGLLKIRMFRPFPAEEVAKVVAAAPEDYDTLIEIAEYIAGDKTGSAQMVNDINALKAISADTRFGCRVL